MNFSVLDAVLNDDEEWFNIPPVVRNFLRQLSNEVQNNRITCDSLLQNTHEHDKLLKGIVSKQMEREFEITKTVLSLQQERQESEVGFRDIVENLRDQMRHINEENQQTRERIRQIEEKEHQTIATLSSLRLQSNNLSKTVNQRLIEFETLLHKGLESLSNDLGELNKETQLLSEKQDNTVLESRKELERFNVALQQLCDAISEEVDNLRIQIHDHEKRLIDIKEFTHEDKVKDEKQVKAYVRLREKLSDLINTIKQVETSSDDRFESVFATLAKLQSLTDKFAIFFQQRGDDHSSLKTILEETREMQHVLGDELRRNLDEQSKKNRKEMESLKEDIIDLKNSKDGFINLLNEENATTKSDIDDMRQRLDTLKCLIPKSNMKEEIETLIDAAMEKGKMVQEEMHKEFQRSISYQEKNTEEELKYLKTRIIELEKKYEHSLTTLKSSNNDDIEGTLQLLMKQVKNMKGALDSLREDVDTVNDTVKNYQEKSILTLNSHKETQVNSLLNHIQGMIDYVSKSEFIEMTISIEEIKRKFSTFENQLNNMMQDVSRFENQTKEIPKTYQGYIEVVERKLSPALIELDVLRKRMASLEIKPKLTEPREDLRISSTTVPEEEDDLDGLRLKLGHNQILQSTQRQIQAVDVRLDSLQTLVQSLERKVGSLSRELTTVSEITTSLGEQEQQKDHTMRNELKHILTQLQNIKDEIEATDKKVESNQKFIQNISTNTKSLEEALETISNEIVGLEKDLKDCVKISSVEWNDIWNKNLTSLNNNSNDKLNKLSNDLETLAPLRRVIETEEMLLQMRKEQEELASRLDKREKIMMENTEFESLYQNNKEINQLLSSVENRVKSLEEELYKDQKHVLTNVNSTLSSLALRIQSCETNLNQFQTSELSTRRPLDEDNKLSQTVDALKERLIQLESSIISLRKIDENSVSNINISLLMDRLKSLENDLLTCKTDVKEGYKDVSLCKERIKQLEEQIASCKDEKEKKHSFSIDSDAVVVVPKDSPFNTTLTEVMERLSKFEVTVEEIKQVLLSQRNDLQSMYTKCQLDARFESFWASVIALLTRKEDQETVDQKVAELRRSLTDDVRLQINHTVRELRRAIDECVRVKEVRELVKSINE
ncbi:uncharacterized protein TM35_000021430 [Trypanosoma theileri]|uniref:Uncharacterized protein n=1 Tax=Trypanosoma theileri TaxID=67003 RepID=A0A1X0P797_9TRYP|nr:uncharacterized protein TM35_000021430 [Trypanosoma theileri]ORC92817.1 hypothetical protein TM35_000021430 [Trypanosoma theileri]